MKVDMKRPIGPDNPPFEEYQDGSDGKWYVAWESLFERAEPIAGPFESQLEAEQQAKQFAGFFRYGWDKGRMEMQEKNPIKRLLGVK